jgi:sulfite dehydrogenase (cytochrome) subunit B
VSNRLRQIIGCLTVLGSATACFAQTTSIELPRDNPFSQIKAGAGDEVVGRSCAICHSTDYIVGQPRLDAQHWNAEVQKMIKTYGAPISDTDAKIIADYLAKNYGTEAESQQPSLPNSPISQLKPNEDRLRQQQNAENEELKALLIKVRPAFVAHLEHAKQVQASLKN